MKKIAIIICINDINYTHGKGPTKMSLKKDLSYFQQFLILYYSIKENWNFNYHIYLVHSRPFKESSLNILKNLDVTLKCINTENLMIRPESYLIDIECDYRLVLDCDMVALNNPSFNFNYDAQAMYGSFNYEVLPNSIFKNLDIIKPEKKKFCNYEIKKGNNSLWNMNHINLIDNYYKNNIDCEKKYYPIFNHGAILVNNKYSKTIGEKLLLYKKKYNTQNGQNVIGYIINDVTNGNWTHFDKGFNFTFNIDRIKHTPNKFKYINENNTINLLHYINLPKNSIYFKKYVKKYYDIIKNMEIQ
jgi:hypothetical protein